MPASLFKSISLPPAPLPDLNSFNLASRPCVSPESSAIHLVMGHVKSIRFVAPNSSQDMMDTKGRVILESECPITKYPHFPLEFEASWARKTNLSASSLIKNRLKMRLTCDQKALLTLPAHYCPSFQGCPPRTSLRLQNRGPQTGLPSPTGPGQRRDKEGQKAQWVKLFK